MISGLLNSPEKEEEMEEVPLQVVLYSMFVLSPCCFVTGLLVNCCSDLTK